MVFSYKTVHLSEDPCYTLDRSGLIENPYIPAIRTRFVQPGKIEIDANERAVIGKRNAAFSFAPSSILSLTICTSTLPYFHPIFHQRKKAPTAIMAMSAALFSQTTLNIFLLCFSFPSFTPFNFSCSLRADSTSSIRAISAAASSIPR